MCQGPDARPWMDLRGSGARQMPGKECAQEGGVWIPIDVATVVRVASKVGAAVLSNIEMHLLSCAQARDCGQENQQGFAMSVAQNELAFREVRVRAQPLNTQQHQGLIEFWQRRIKRCSLGERHSRRVYACLVGSHQVIIRERTNRNDGYRVLIGIAMSIESGNGALPQTHGANTELFGGEQSRI